MPSTGPTAPRLPDIGAGTRPTMPPDYLNPVLRHHGEWLSRETTRRFYETWPGLSARYGERGKAHTYEDNFWHMATLDTALSLDAPAIFPEPARRVPPPGSPFPA